MTHTRKLAKIIEKLGEVIQAYGKMIGSGEVVYDPANYYLPYYTPLRHKLIDLNRSIDEYLVEHNQHK